MSGTGRGDLSRLHVVVPLRTLDGGKSRLGAALDAEEREDLIVGMLRHLLATIGAWGGAADVLVVSPDPALLSIAAATGARTLRQRSGDLNDGISLGIADAAAREATAVLVLPADLPLLEPTALARLRDAADAALAAGSGRALVAIVPAEARNGTNALLLSPPDVIAPAFGEDSLRAHLEAAHAANASLQLVDDPALGFDLDTPGDVERLDSRRLAELQAIGADAGVVASAADRDTDRAVGDMHAQSAMPGAPPPGAAPGEGTGRLLAVPLPPLPDIRPGDDLGLLIADALRAGAAGDPELVPRPGDVLVVTQKIVSKAEGRITDLRSVTPRPEAALFARRWDRDARQVEVVLRESSRVVRMDRGVIISRTAHGYVCANAGVDASNTDSPDLVTLLPQDPDRSAREIRSRVRELVGVDLAVVVADSFGRPWRWGIADVALGVSGFAPLADFRGMADTAGREMHATVVAVADEICAAAELASGKTSRRPVVLVRGAPLPVGDGSIVGDVVMPEDFDLFA